MSYEAYSIGVPYGHFLEYVPKDGNIILDRFFLSISFSGDVNINFKALYVIGWHRDKIKYMILHYLATIQPQNIHKILALASMHDFKVWTADVSHAYLKAAKNLSP